MTKKKLPAWKAGKFQFSQLTTEQDNDVYGRMKTEAPLKQILGED